MPRMTWQPNQVLPVRGRQLPRFFHQAPIVLRVEYLWAVILLDVHSRPTIILELLFLEDLYQHAERWCKAPPGGFPRRVIPFVRIEESCYQVRTPHASKTPCDLRLVRRGPFWCADVQVHALAICADSVAMILGTALAMASVHARAN